MKLAINNIEGKKIGEIAVPELLAKSSMNQNAVRQAVLAEMVNLRQGTHSSKNRSAVRGGGKKPWKQKGRGVARAGTIRSPLWKGVVLCLVLILTNIDIRFQKTKHSSQKICFFR